MSEPLEYGRPAKPARASVILGLLSIACPPSAFLIFSISGDRISYHLAYAIMWLFPIIGLFMALSGIASRKSSWAVAAWIGMVLNLLFLGLLTFARYY